MGFLAAPRDWNTLAIWAKSKRISGDKLRNLLAWISIMGLADVKYELTGAAPIIPEGESAADMDGLSLFWFKV